MNATSFIQVLNTGLVPYLNDVNEDPRFMQDNDPRHTSRRAGYWMEDMEINWWKTPAKSPDMNPIENLWHELKEYIQRAMKPKTKDTLVAGILELWDKVDTAKCQKYICNLW